MDLIHRDKECIERIHVGPGDRCDSAEVVCSRESICNPSTSSCVCPSSHVHVQQVRQLTYNFNYDGILRNAERLSMFALEIGVQERNGFVSVMQNVLKADVNVRPEHEHNTIFVFKYPKVC